MMQAAISSSESPLLESAALKLSPGVFSHPIWVRFGQCNDIHSSKTINDLFVEADKLLHDKPEEACQVLFLCAVFQNYDGQSGKALTTVQKIRVLAEKARLNQELIWSLWGAAAICFQQGDMEESANRLGELQGFLSIHNEWVLADLIDIVRQAMLQPSQRNLSDGCLTTPFQWLKTWGLSPQIYTGTKETNQQDPKRIPFLSLQGWRSLRFRFAGELKVLWTESRSQSGSKRVPLWRSILNLLQFNQTADKNDPDVIELPSEPVADLAPHSEPILETKIDTKRNSASPISMSVHMLGPFRLEIQETALDLPPSRKMSLLQYLVINHTQSTPREVLMDIFWPDVSPEGARNNLNVAISGIRRAFRTLTDTPILLYKNNAYGLVPGMQLWMDVEEFQQLIDSGRRLEAQGSPKASINAYEAAISLYQGDFLEETPYESWTTLPRERLRLAYLVTLDHLSQIYYRQENYALCIALSQRILLRDRCREDAHCMLMRCFSRQGQDHLAIRQYQACADALRMELDVTPTPETIRLYEQIRQHHRV